MEIKTSVLRIPSVKIRNYKDLRQTYQKDLKDNKTPVTISRA
jgi:hypothetical protein